MRRAMMLLGLLLWGLMLSPGARAQGYLPGEVLVQLNPGVNLNQFLSTYGLYILDQSPYVPAYRLAVTLPLDINLLVALLRLDPNVAAADPNLVLNALGDQNSGDQWTSTFDSGGQTDYQNQNAIAQVDYAQAANISTGSGTVVAILDTGISCRPAFLAPQVVAGWNFVDNNANTDDCPTGTDSNQDGIPDEAAGHGTMVAGTIYRFAPQALLMPVRVLDSDGCGSLWAAVQGVRYATANGASVVNMSFGSPQNSGMMTKALNDAYNDGVVLVASAGNHNTNTPQYPAGNTHVVAVAALNADNSKASFSNFGSAISLAAPGVGIVGPSWDGRYFSWSGTSFSAPMVSAEAVLLHSVRPSWSASQVTQRLLATSHSVNSWNPSYQNQLGKNGAGLIDMDAALSNLP